ncbi:MAG: hypothetical protein NTV11_15315 [Rhodocyclales bacterium]|nr:hypothetical protein [Rhodocyclales bacterium]
MIYAGAGNDHAWGGIGNDVIFGEGGLKPAISDSYFLAALPICSLAFINHKIIMGNSGFKSRRRRHGEAESLANTVRHGGWRTRAANDVQWRRQA